MGPTFVQDPDNFREDNFFVRSFRKDIETAKLVIFSTSINLGINDEVRNTLKNDFTTEPPEVTESIEKPEDFYYTVYYRK